jgi:hypothetical protein
LCYSFVRSNQRSNFVCSNFAEVCSNFELRTHSLTCWFFYKLVLISWYNVVLKKSILALCWHYVGTKIQKLENPGQIRGCSLNHLVSCAGKQQYSIFFAYGFNLRWYAWFETIKFFFLLLLALQSERDACLIVNRADPPAEICAALAQCGRWLSNPLFYRCPQKESCAGATPPRARSVCLKISCPLARPLPW